MDNETRQLLADIASDGDLASIYPEYRRRALALLIPETKLSISATLLYNGGCCAQMDD